MMPAPGVLGIDPGIPFLERALDPDEVAIQLRGRIDGTADPAARIVVRAIRTLRHKPGRRCLIEYEVEVTRRPAMAPEVVTLLGKVRRRGADIATFNLLRALHDGGFARGCPDGIAVPEPVALVPELGLWLQLKVGGTPAAARLDGPDGVSVARRLVEAAHKVHRAAVPARRRHAMADELRILHACLETLAARRPEWAPRLARLLRACDRIAAVTPAQTPRGIHRDFYPDHALLDGNRLYLVDFDLYCEGDAALDIGNCIGHITEQSLRVRNDPRALAHVEAAMEDRLVDLAGEGARPAVRSYALLTLVRHIYITAQIEERRPFTASLLEWCEERLDVAGRTHP
jgi:hypothetical protein